MTETTYRLAGAGAIALLADLHNRPYFPVIQSLSDRRPEMICIAGDVIYGGSPDEGHLLIQTQEYVLPFLRACSGIAPTFLSLGNHELTLADEDLQMIRETGCTILDNSWTVFNGMVIGGMSSHYVLEYRRFREGKQQKYPKRRYEARVIRRPDTDWLEEFEKQPGYRILLRHHPQYTGGRFLRNGPRCNFPLTEKVS